MSTTMEVAGALSVLPPSHARILDDNGTAVIGDIGLVSFRIAEVKLPVNDILFWVRSHVCCTCASDPFPYAQVLLLYVEFHGTS